MTIVTVTRNAAAILQQTIDSVAAQTARDRIEYLVVDGASDDGTRELIEANASRIDRWISEKDAGIYDAMNKGVRMARGAWIHFLNAGDVFVEASAVERADLERRKSGIVYGDYYRIYPGGFRSCERSRPPRDIWKGMICSHQSVFAATELLRVHPFETVYTVCADFQFLQWAYKEGCSFTRLDFAVSEVALERYTWRQLEHGLFQKWKASRATLRRPGTDLVFAAKAVALAGKQLVKKVLPLSWLKAVR
ncbi:MAG: glycosyltransferase family 2 protein [Treponema sp.]|nr:glycosyltransferase family 2 protein [Treponema sp.]